MAATTFSPVVRVEDIVVKRGLYMPNLSGSSTQGEIRRGVRMITIFCMPEEQSIRNGKNCGIRMPKMPPPQPTRLIWTIDEAAGTQREV
jgi:hypothetical protein